MSTTNEQLENVRKRLAWRASRRGIKEMDIVVGGFADARLPMMTPQELISWVTGQEELPQELRSPMLLDLLAFRPVTA
jgi:antitoxin CptB